MKLTRFLNVFMMFVVALGVTSFLASCSKDDKKAEDSTPETIEISSFENTLWRGSTTMTDPVITNSYVDMEVDETRIFFGPKGEALVCVKYKEVSSITGYENGEMINYAHYEVSGNVLNVTTYTDNGQVEGTYTFTKKNGVLMYGDMSLSNVRSFNADDTKFFEDKMLYYGPDEKRFDFDIAESVTKYNADWFKYDPSLSYYNLYVNVNIKISKEQKLWERGITEVVAYITYSGESREQRYSLLINPGQDAVLGERLLLTKKKVNEFGRVVIRYEAWDHKKNVYKRLTGLNAYDF